MKRRNLMIGAAAGMAGGSVANWSSFNYFSILGSDLPSSYLPTLALCSGFFGLLGGLISGIISVKFGGTKTVLLLGAILGFGFGCVGGVFCLLRTLIFLVRLFLQGIEIIEVTPTGDCLQCNSSTISRQQWNSKVTNTVLLRVSIFTLLVGCNSE